MILDKFKLKALRLLPKNAVSRAFGVVSDVPLPRPLRGVVNRGFATYAGVDLSEAESGPHHYETLNAFFTRRLKPGTHTVESDGASDLVSPCDGRLVQFGRIRRDTLVQAKGRDYRLVDLVDSGREAATFAGGSYATIYLSPRDYHRVHSPVAGEVRQLSYVPGHLFPVNPFAVENIDCLFAVNERLITYVDTESLGRVGVVMVGATCVGRIGLAFSEFVTNASFRRREDIALDEPVALEHGGELGMFNLGSTVILLIGSERFEFDPDLKPDSPVRMGQLLGSVPPSD